MIFNHLLLNLEKSEWLRQETTGKGGPVLKDLCPRELDEISQNCSSKHVTTFIFLAFWMPD